MVEDRDAEIQRTVALEERAHRLRLAMLRDTQFNADLRAGREAAERGEVLTLEQLDRHLDEMD